MLKRAKTKFRKHYIQWDIPGFSSMGEIFDVQNNNIKGLKNDISHGLKMKFNQDHRCYKLERKNG